MKKVLLASVLCCALSSCASVAPQPEQIVLSAPFDLQSTTWFKAKGTASVTGQAFIQTRGGQPRTCAGLEVNLVPKSKYADERLVAMYNSTESGFRSAKAPRLAFTPESPMYSERLKKSVCDAQGNFVFSDLPAGDYFVVTTLVWSVPGGYLPEGGAMFKAFSLAAGESKRVILTP